VSMVLHRVKLAVFDLLLVVIIVGYLGLVYLGVVNITVLIDFVHNRMKRSKIA